MAAPIETIDRHRSTPLRNRPQRIAHLLVVAAGWVLFGWGWHKVAGQAWDTDSLMILIGGSLIMLPTLTVLWIAHNLRIHRQKGPRTRSRPAGDDYRHDWNGREVDAYWPAMATAQIVVVDIVDERKVFRAANTGKTPANGDRRRRLPQDPPDSQMPEPARPSVDAGNLRERVA